MFNPNLIMNQSLGLSSPSCERERGGEAIKAALSLFRKVRVRGWLARTWGKLTGRLPSLISLSEVEKKCTVRGRCYDGIHSVPLDKIRGSEGREQDFDAHFNPLHASDRDRWVGVAAAWQSRASLPPVELIQVGDVYFVRDGHHRISVARALGQEAIDAEVTVWRVSGPLPWEQRQPAYQPAQQII
ncbi:MAG: hypothetical protein ACP5GX_09765 [Anaerolineae bacterium]